MQKKILIQICLFLLLVGPIFALTVFSYTRVRDALTSVVTLRSESLATLSALLIQERLDRIVDIGTLLASRVQFQQFAEEGKWQEAIATLQIPPEFTFIERLFLTDKGGVLRADAPHQPNIVGRSFAERDWYKGVSQNWEPYVSEVYKRATEPKYNVVAVAIPIKASSSAGSKNKASGILVLEIKLDAFLEWTKEITLNGNGFIYITDRRGYVIAYPRFNLQEDLVDFSSTPSVKKALLGLSGVEILYNSIDKENQLSAYAPVLGRGWTVVVAESTTTAFAQRDSILQNILFVYSIINLFAVFFVYWILRNRARIQNANQQLREIDQQKSEFISITSHQLRTPLGSMRWNLELLEPEVKSLSEVAQERLQETYRSNLHVIELVGDFLNVARIEQGRVKNEPKLANILEIIQSAVKEMEPEALKKLVTLNIKIKKPNIPKIIIDPNRFREVIQNLLSNAVKYTLKGGSVSVEIDYTVNFIEIAVLDNGIGIPEKDKIIIFTKFARAKNATLIDTEGSGLGLYIVKSFVEGWGGKVYFKSHTKEESLPADRQGTTFYISLPLTPKVVSDNTTK